MFRFRSSRSSIPGQPSPGSDSGASASYCAGVHAPNPDPADGLTVNPSGNVTSASFRFEVETEIGFSQLCGLVIVKSRPLGDSAAFVVGCASIEGSKGIRSHSSIGAILVVSLKTSPGSCQSLLFSVAVNGSPAQLVGFDRNGLGVSDTDSLPPVQ